MDNYNQHDAFYHPGKYNKPFFLRERKKDSWGGGVEAEGKRESQVACTFRAEPDKGLDLTTLRSGPTQKSSQMLN